MIKPVFFVSFSGHRPKSGVPGRSDGELLATAPLILEELQKLCEQVESVGGELHFVGSLAAGADIVACNEARKLGMPLHVILPKDEEAFYRDDFPGDLACWRNPSLKLLAAADPHALHKAKAPFDKDALRILDEEGNDFEPPFDRSNTSRVASTIATSPDCYVAVNAWMLEIADIVITVSGRPAVERIEDIPEEKERTEEELKNHSAGSAHVGKQACVLGLPHINIDPAPAEGADARSSARRDKFGSTSARTRRRDVFKELDRHLTCDLTASDQPFDDLAACLETAANKSSLNFRRATAFAITFHAIAGFIAAGVAASTYALKKYWEQDFVFWLFAVLALVELGFVAYALILEVLVSRNKEQHTWLDCRFAREIMRGLRTANPFLDPLFPEIRRHRPQWERFATSCALLLRSQTGPIDPRSDDAVSEAKNGYLEKRVRNQIEHFKEKHEEARVPTAWFKKLAHLAGPAALVVVGCAFLAKFLTAIFQGDMPSYLGFLENPFLGAIAFLFLPIFVPLLASLSSSFLAAFDFGRRSVRYLEMIEFLEQSENWLETLHTYPNIRAVVRRSEEILLDENIEWLAAQKSGFGH